MQMLIHMFLYMFAHMSMLRSHTRVIARESEELQNHAIEPSPYRARARVRARACVGERARVCAWAHAWMRVRVPSL